ncbi:ABC transporter substrate-binding protein [Granulicoccus sp. GXG6511]|uniref:ABC transporter substrate-binding protein n=1 Tax=Granulicoccus sp. GXG6511 TaxID=3381351 RepID=UPI003D7C5300
MFRSAAKKVGAVVAAATLALSLAACGGDGAGTGGTPAGGGGGDGAPEKTELTIGFIPVADQAGLIRAINEGYFEAEGLKVTPQTAQGGAAALPAMVAGDLDGVFGTYPSFLLAQQNVAKVKIVALGVGGSEDFAGVFVNPEANIADAQGLVGKKLAVNTLNNTGELSIKSVLTEQGVDPAQVEFIEMPFPDMTAALERGAIDAAWAVEPFQTQMTEAGMTKLFSNFSGKTATAPLAGIGMTEKFVEDNPNTVAAFARAVEKANADLADDPESVRELVPTYSQTSPEVAAKMHLPVWEAGYPTADKIAVWNDVMVELGSLQGPVDLEEIIYSPPAQ